MAHPIDTVLTHRQKIVSDEITFHDDCSIKIPSDDELKAICILYEASYDEVCKDVLDGESTFYAICQNDRLIGSMQLDYYSSFEGLTKQVSDEALARYLDDRKIHYEISYALIDEAKGKGIGKAMVQAWSEKAFKSGLITQVFAVVANDNIASQKVLTNAGFIPLGEYDHPKTEETCILYTWPLRSKL